MTQRLDGRGAIVTGAGSGIGCSCRSSRVAAMELGPRGIRVNAITGDMLLVDGGGHTMRYPELARRFAGQDR